MDISDSEGGYCLVVRLRSFIAGRCAYIEYISLSLSLWEPGTALVLWRY